MGLFPYLIFAVLWLAIYANVKLDDLPGKYLVEPGWDGLRFCTGTLEIEASEDTVSRIVFGTDDTVCADSTLTFVIWDSKDNIRGTMALSGLFNCAGFRIRMNLRRPILTHERRAPGFLKNFTYVKDEVYLTMYEPNVNGAVCVYRKDIPGTKTRSAPSNWIWAGPLIFGIASAILSVCCAFTYKRARTSSVSNESQVLTVPPEPPRDALKWLWLGPLISAIGAITGSIISGIIVARWK